MGTSSDEAEARVRQQRALIERKVEDLESRVGQDLSAARERATHRVTHFTDMVPGGTMLVERAQAHPMTAVTGGLGLGVALGLLTGGNDGAHDPARRDGRSDAGMGSMAMGAANTLASGLSAGLLSPLRPYVEDMAKQLIAGFTDGASRTQRSGQVDRPSRTAGA